MNTRTPSAIDEYVGKEIRRIRKAAGLSMMELADKLGMSYQQIQKYEIGANRVSAGVLYEVACLFHMDIRDFFPPLKHSEVQTEQNEEIMRDLLQKLDQAGVLEAFKRSLDLMERPSKTDIKAA